MDIRYYKHALIINKEPENAYVSISTFWTPKDKVEELISEENKKKVLVIGQCYTYEGMKFIQYNVCANPKFQIMIVTGFDNNKILPRIKSEERGTLDYPEYEDLFWNYWGHGDNTGITIPKDVDAELKGNMIFLKDYKQIDTLLSSLKYRKDWLESPVIIPPPVKSAFETLDSEKTGFIVRDSNLYRLWRRGLIHIQKFGTMVDGTREVMNLVSVLTSEPKLHKDFPAAEQSEQYLPQVCNDKPTDGLVYTYGSRLHGRNQIDEIVKSLSEGIFNRNGVSTTWEPPSDYSHPPPCLVLATFRIHPLKKGAISTNTEFKEYIKTHSPSERMSEDYRPKNFLSKDTLPKESTSSKIASSDEVKDDKQWTHILYTNTVFRSHDYYKGMPMNLWALWYLGQKVINAIQAKIGNDIQIKHGQLTNLSIAAHVYEQDFKKFMNTGLDYRGYFTISILRDVKKIRVALMSNENKEVESWESDNPQELCDKTQLYISDISHAMYMGRELMRAKQCLIDGSEYKQD